MKLAPNQEIASIEIFIVNSISGFESATPASALTNILYKFPIALSNLLIS